MHRRAVAGWTLVVAIALSSSCAGPEPEPKPGFEPTWESIRTHEVPTWFEDAKFAGDISEGGIFTPAVAGPNPERPFSTNNAGDLKIVAEAGGQTASARLV